MAEFGRECSLGYSEKASLIVLHQDGDSPARRSHDQDVMRGQRRDDTGKRNRRIVAEVDDRVMTDDMDREMGKVDGHVRSDLQDIVPGQISGPEVIDDVMTGRLPEDECVPTRTIHDIVRRR